MKMDKVRIERPKLEEEFEINQFFRLVLEDTFKKNGLLNMEELLEEEVEDKRRCLRQDFDSTGAMRHFLIAWLDQRIVGTIEFGAANDLISACTENKLRHLMEIGTVFVHPEFQNKGIGKALLDAIFEKMMDAGLEEYCFDSGYPEAQKIWIHVFGEPEYHLKNYWGEGADHMVWRGKIAERIE